MEIHAASPCDDNMDMIDAYIEHVESTSRSRSRDTPRHRRVILNALQRDLPHGIDHTCTEELIDWLNAPNSRTGATRSANTLATYLTCLRSAYAFWADPADPWINEDPTVGIPHYPRQKGRARPGAEEQLAFIIEHGTEPYRLWTIIAAYQGLRCVELSGLNREHITAQRLIVVRGKGGRSRVHDTDPLVWSAVRDLPPGPVCRDITTGGRAGPNHISLNAGRYFRSIGFPGLTMHMWRHRLGVQVQRLYRDIRVTQEMLGHDSLTSTQIYTDASEDQTREARAMLPRPGAGPAGYAGAA
jgi:integrase/recombinase XerC